MVFNKRWLFAMMAWILVLVLLPACVTEKSTPGEPPVSPPTSVPRPVIPPIPVEEVTMEEAEQIIGAPIAPKYLPPGWEFHRGFVYYGPAPHLNLYFSDEEIAGEVKTAQDFASLTNKKIILNVDRVEEMPSTDIYEGMSEQYGGSVVDINETKGWLSSSGHSLYWTVPGLHFFMFVVEYLTEEEMLRIARSIK